MAGPIRIVIVGGGFVACTARRPAPTSGRPAPPPAGPRRVAPLIGGQHPVPGRGQRLRHPDPAGGGLWNPCSSTTGSPLGGPAASTSNTSPRARSRSRSISIAPLGMPGRVAALVALKPVWCAIGRSTCLPAPGADSRRLLTATADGNRMDSAILAHGSGVDDLIVFASTGVVVLTVRQVILRRRVPEDPEEHGND